MNARRVVPVLLVVVVVIAVWWWRPRGPVPSEAPSSASPRPQLAVQLELIPAGPDDESVMIVRVYDRGQAQREALIAAEAATGRTWGGSTRAQRLSPPPAVPPEAWPTLVTLTVVASAGTRQLAVAPATAREADAALFLARLEPGSHLTATLPYEGRLVTSNTVTVPTFPDHTSRLVARGRAAEALSRADVVADSATRLLALDANSVWGDYLRGTALELSGDRPGARAAYQRALSHVVPSSEPPMGLILRIERTQ